MKTVNKLNEVIDVNGSKIFIEDGKVKTVLNEDLQKRGRMTTKELRELLYASLKKHRDLIKSRNK